MTSKRHIVFQMNVHRQKEARHDNLDSENTLLKILGCSEKYCRTKTSFKDNFIDNKIWPFALSTGEEEEGYRWGQELLLVRKNFY